MSLELCFAFYLSGKLPLFFLRAGARLKVMRHLKGGPVDFGLGLNLELDSMQLTVPLRAKVYDCFSVKLLPRSMVKFQRTWRVPGTQVNVRVMYDCPLSALKQLDRPPARLLVR